MSRSQPLDHDELIQRISRDLADSYDEELRQFPYRDVEKSHVVLPPRERRKDYSRQPVPDEMLVPEVY